MIVDQFRIYVFLCCKNAYLTFIFYQHFLIIAFSMKRGFCRYSRLMNEEQLFYFIFSMPNFTCCKNANWLSFLQLNYSFFSLFSLFQKVFLSGFPHLFLLKRSFQFDWFFRLVCFFTSLKEMPTLFWRYCQGFRKNLGKRSEVIIFESLLITFDHFWSNIFLDSLVITLDWLEP